MFDIVIDIYMNCLRLNWRDTGEPNSLSNILLFSEMVYSIYSIKVSFERDATKD